MDIDESDQKLMTEYGITAEAKLLFHYDGHKYERLADALNYAMLHRPRPAETGKSALEPDSAE
jgi:hypothetical protein